MQVQNYDTAIGAHIQYSRASHTMSHLPDLAGDRDTSDAEDTIPHMQQSVDEMSRAIKKHLPDS